MFSGGRRVRRKPTTLDIFLRRCLRLIVGWALILGLMLTTVGLIIRGGGSLEDWAGGLFASGCVLEFAATVHVIPATLRFLRDRLYRDCMVRTRIWQLRGLVLLNLITVVGAIAWIVWFWCTRTENENIWGRIMRWLMFAINTVLSLVAKGLFIAVYLRIKRHMAHLFVDFRVLPKEGEEDIAVEVPPERARGPEDPDAAALPEGGASAGSSPRVRTPAAEAAKLLE